MVLNDDCSNLLLLFVQENGGSFHNVTGRKYAVFDLYYYTTFNPVN